MKIGFTGINI